MTVLQRPRMTRTWGSWSTNGRQALLRLRSVVLTCGQCCARSDGPAGAQARSALRELAADEAALVAMGQCGGFHACAASLERGDGDGADAAAVLWAGSSKKASLTDVARALDVRSSRGPAIGRDVDLAIRALLRRTRSKAGKKDA